MAKNVPKRQNEKLETIKDIAPLKEILSSQEYTLFQDSANEEEKKLFESILLIAEKFQESVSKTELNRSSVLARIIYDTLGNDLIDILSNEENLKKFKEKLSDSIKKDTTAEKVSDKEIDDIINKAVNDKISVLLGDSSKSSTKKISKEQQNLLDSFKNSFSGLEKTQNKIYQKNRELYNNILTFSKKLKSLNVSSTTTKKSATSISSITTSKKETEKISKTVKTDTNKSESHDTSIASTEKEVTNLITFNLSSVQNLNDQITAQQKGAEKQNKKDEKKRKSFLSKLLSGTIFLLAAPLIIIGKTLFAVGKAILLPLYILSKFSLKKIVGLILKPIHWIGGILGGFFKKQEGEAESRAHKFFRGLFNLIFISKKFWFFVGFFWGKIYNNIFKPVQPTDGTVKDWIQKNPVYLYVIGLRNDLMEWAFGPDWKNQMEEKGFFGVLKQSISGKISEIKVYAETQWKLAKEEFFESDTYAAIQHRITKLNAWYKDNEPILKIIFGALVTIAGAVSVAMSTLVGRTAIGSLKGIRDPVAHFIGTLLAIGVAMAAHGIMSLFTRKKSDEPTWENMPLNKRYRMAIGDDIDRDNHLKRNSARILAKYTGTENAKRYSLENLDTAIRAHDALKFSMTELDNLLDNNAEDGFYSFSRVITEESKKRNLDPFLYDSMLSKIFNFSWLGVSNEYSTKKRGEVLKRFANKTVPEKLFVLENFLKSRRSLQSVVSVLSKKVSSENWMDFINSNYNDVWYKYGKGVVDKLFSLFLSQNLNVTKFDNYVKENEFNIIAKYLLKPSVSSFIPWFNGKIEAYEDDDPGGSWKTMPYKVDPIGGLILTRGNEEVTDLTRMDNTFYYRFGKAFYGYLAAPMKANQGGPMPDDAWEPGTNKTIPHGFGYLRRLLALSDNPASELTLFLSNDRVPKPNALKNKQAFNLSPITAMFQIVRLFNEFPGIYKSNNKAEIQRRIKSLYTDADKLYDISSVSDLSEKMFGNGQGETLENLAESFTASMKSTGRSDSEDTKYLIYVMTQILKACEKKNI